MESMKDYLIKSGDEYVQISANNVNIQDNKLIFSVGEIFVAVFAKWDYFYEKS
jgi:hypothetical protein